MKQWKKRECLKVFSCIPPSGADDPCPLSRAAVLSDVIYAVLESRLVTRAPHIVQGELVRNWTVLRLGCTGPTAESQLSKNKPILREGKKDPLGKNIKLFCNSLLFTLHTTCRRHWRQCCPSGHHTQARDIQQDWSRRHSQRNCCLL